MQSPERPSKQEAFLAFLRGGWTSLHLDARRPGVIVPTHLRGEAHLVLQYGYDLPIPISDLEIDDLGVRATLSFSKSPQRTVVPWSAVYVVACVDGRGILYHDDVPEDVSIVAARPPGDEGAFDDVLESDGSSDGDGLSLGEGGGVAGGAGAGAGGAPGRITERLLRSVPEDGTFDVNDGNDGIAGNDPAAERPLPVSGPRRRRRPQLRLVK
jgi:stringent starvation protein B